MTGESEWANTVVGEDGGITIPNRLLGALGWKAGDTLLCHIREGIVLLVKTVDSDDVRGET